MAKFWCCFSPSSTFAGGVGFGGGGERTGFRLGGDGDAHRTASCQWFCLCGSEFFPAQTTFYRPLRRDFHFIIVDCEPLRSLSSVPLRAGMVLLLQICSVRILAGFRGFWRKVVVFRRVRYFSADLEVLCLGVAVVSLFARVAMVAGGPSVAWVAGGFDVVVVILEDLR
jgi:hypothetical protein